jgi:CheY-like chemotaxis protein
MPGPALCRWLRERSETRLIPIILHTGQTLPPTDPLYDRVITKPGDIDALLSEVHALLELSRWGRPGAQSD